MPQLKLFNTPNHNQLGGGGAAGSYPQQQPLGLIEHLQSTQQVSGENEEVKSDKLAYYSKLYSGSHAKIPLPTANSIIPKKY